MQNSRAPREFKIRVPLDVVAPQHQVVNKGLVRWGVWNSERRGSAAGSSFEGMYSRGGRDPSPPATAPAVDHSSMAIERAVTRMPKEQRDLLRLFYVRRFTPLTICHVQHLLYEDFASSMFTARALVIVMQCLES